MSKWTPYQTDHLFLLVGTNPLPNYVAARLLAKENGTIYLLHSKGPHGTGQVAINLQAAIPKPQLPGGVILREIDEADSSRIVQKMTCILSKIDTKASVGLNYTGGTKSMAVHAYRAVKGRFPSAVCSYLDARSLSLVIDGDDGQPTKMIPIERDCEVDLENLVALHGRKTDSLEKDTRFPNLCRYLVDLHATDPAVWRSWCNANLKRADGKLKGKTALRTVELLALARTAMLSEWGSDAQVLGDVPLPTGWRIDHLAEWLDGKWLEHYVLDCVRQAVGECHGHSCGMNLKPRQQFEFDVAVMQGYRLFALACTTDSDKGMCKLKLFEAYVRARQMGGDEACVALVCCYQDPDALRQEIEENWFTEGRVAVFGMADLPNLSTRLKNWFEMPIRPSSNGG